MSQQQLDAQGEAHEALATAVSSYGQRVLNDPHMLGNLAADLLPDLPRERSLVVMAAEAGTAAELKQRVEEQHIDADTAVRLVAQALSERRAIDPTASMWVATEFAQALGYRVRPFAQPVQPGQPEVIPTSPPTMTSFPGQPMPPGQSWPPPGPTWDQPTPGASVPPGQQWTPPGQAASVPPGQQWTPPAQSWPPAQGPSGGPPTSANWGKRRLIAAITVAGLVVAYLVVAAVAHTTPFTKSHPVAAVSPSAKPSHKPTPTPIPTPKPTLAAGITPLLQLLPEDIDDPTTQCKTIKKPDWKMPGLVTPLTCSDPNLPNGSVDAYQVDSNADYKTAWANFNSWWGFDTSTAKADCPPSTSGGEGLTTWNSKGFPTKQGQVLECWTVTGDAPTYVWTLPTQDMFIIAVGGNGTTFKALNSWWTSDNSGPANLPTATPSPQTS
jgi:hypothetical protein